MTIKSTVFVLSLLFATAIQGDDSFFNFVDRYGSSHWATLKSEEGTWGIYNQEGKKIQELNPEQAEEMRSRMRLVTTEVSFTRSDKTVSEAKVLRVIEFSFKDGTLQTAGGIPR